MLSGIYSMLRSLTAHLCPSESLPPELAPLGKGWLLDIHTLHQYELHQLQESRDNHPHS